MCVLQISSPFSAKADGFSLQLSRRNILHPMAKAAPKLRKTLSQTNLAQLGADRLASLLFAAAATDPALKRSLRFELASEVGAAELAQALDKRLDELATSRARISWRKRPELLRELALLRTMIVERLSTADAALAFPRLVAWFDLQEPLQARTKDPRAELVALFEAATPDLGPMAFAAGYGVALPVLAHAIFTRSNIWVPLLGRAMGTIDHELATGLLDSLTSKHIPQTGRLVLIVRRLADRVGNLDIWLASFDDKTSQQPEIQVERALRLARGGRTVEARTALDAALLQPPRKRLGWHAPEPAPVRDERWFDAEIAVLDSEGRSEDAMTGRWLKFERTLSVASLNDIVSRLGDFEDVVATDRALGFAAGYFDLNRALAFMMEQGALREAAETIVTRPDELTGRIDATALWASRLATRYPVAAMQLLRARARFLVEMSGSLDADGVSQLLDEAQALAATAGDDEIVPHSVYVEQLRRIPLRSTRSGRR